jgi:hypothetical protein
MAEASVPLLHVECPECKQEIPVTLETEVRDGNLELDVCMADVWAHSFTHD